MSFSRKVQRQITNLAKKGQATNQVLELPLENCIYDMISAEGTKGITLVEVLLGNLTLVQLCGIICF